MPSTSSLILGFDPVAGQKLMANSFPVVISSDQSILDVNILNDSLDVNILNDILNVDITGIVDVNVINDQFNVNILNDFLYVDVTNVVDVNVVNDQLEVSDPGIGNITDSVNTDPTENLTVISLLKGLLTVYDEKFDLILNELKQINQYLEILAG